MGIGSIVAGALRRVPWTSLAMNYGPELVRRFGGKVLNRENEPQDDPSGAEAEETIRQLQALYDEQREINLRQQEQLHLLQQSCAVLEAQLKRYRLIAAACVLVAAILAIVLLARM